MGFWSIWESCMRSLVPLHLSWAKEVAFLIWETSLQKKLWFFLNYCFRCFLFPNVCITQKIWVYPGLWYFWFLFSYLEGSFVSTCVHFLHTLRHTKKIWSDLWFYFSLRKENKNVKRFWISAITMKNICWSLCKHKFILPWACLLKLRFFFLRSYFSFIIWKGTGRNLLHFGAAVKQRWPNFIYALLDGGPESCVMKQCWLLCSFSLLNCIK